MSKELEDIDKKIKILENEIVKDIINNSSLLKDLTNDLENNVNDTEKIINESINNFYKLSD